MVVCPNTRVPERKWLENGVVLYQHRGPIHVKGHPDGLQSWFVDVSHANDEEIKKEYYHKIDGYKCKLYHTLCYKALNNTGLPTIVFDFLPHIHDTATYINDSDIFPCYHPQSNLDEMIKDGKGWLLENPTQNQQNKDRIVKIFRLCEKRHI